MNDNDRDAEASSTMKNSNDVQIRVQQRNGRKSLTSVAGLRQDLDFERVCAAFKRIKGVNGIVVDAVAGSVLQFSGDVAQDLADWLVNEKICSRDRIKIFGSKS